MIRISRSPLALALVTAGLLPLALVARADDPPKPAPEKPAEAPAAPAQPEPPAAPEKAKDFTLKDLDGKERKLSEFAGKWVVLEWTNYGCPFVKKHYQPVPGATEADPATPGNIPALQKKYAEKGVIWLSICSSGPGKEGHMTPAAWKEAVKERMASPTAVLLDEDGKVGKDYGAKNTPAVWIVDPKGFIAYTGAVDDQPKARANPAEATSYITQALDAGLAGQPIPICVTKPYG